MIPAHGPIVLDTACRLMLRHFVVRGMPMPSNDNIAAATDDDLAEIVVCQGPPRCALDGDAAVEAQKAGCPWCKRIVIHDDHSETVTEPGCA